jgi:valyl-tRNA synthetase
MVALFGVTELFHYPSLATSDGKSFYCIIFLYIKSFISLQRHNEVVVEAMVRLWNAGLVYRKESLINWSCELSSAISDIEVDRLEVSGPTPINVPGYDKPVMFGELMKIAFKVCDSGKLDLRLLFGWL